MIDVRALRTKTRPTPTQPAEVADSYSPAETDRGLSRLRAGLIGLDVIGGVLTWVVVLMVVHDHAWRARLGRSFLTAGALSLLTVLILALHQLYRTRIWAVRSLQISSLARSLVLCAIAAVWFNQTAHVGPRPTIIVLGAACVFVVLAGLRLGYTSWLRMRRASGAFCQRVCILGANDEAEMLVDLLQSQPELGYRIVAVLGDAEDWAGRNSDIPAIDLGSDPAVAAREAGASTVLVTASGINPRDLDQVVRRLVRSGLHVQISTGLTRVGHQRIRAYPLSHQPLFYVEPPRLSPWQLVLKRAIDVVVASFALLVSAPVLLAAAVAIKLDDGGPIFYRQERVGRLGNLFRVNKLRTMVPDASARLAEFMEHNERSGPLFKLSYDPRVTRVGRFLRASSIDELPQLINVLRGEMSLVGPRPALPTEVAQFDAELLERASVTPGITGLWQVEARDNPSFHAYRRLDLFYVENWSLMLDMTILMATLGVVLGRAVRILRRGGEVLPPVQSTPSVEPASAGITPLIPTAVRESMASSEADEAIA
jgi:exopolysaccharide biosynthesis polyprenyl glycosylphosphotransferase